MQIITRLLVGLTTWNHRRLAGHDLDPEGGQTVNEWLGLSALAIVAIVVIGAALQALGVDIINWIRDQLGIPAS